MRKVLIFIYVILNCAIFSQRASLVLPLGHTHEITNLEFSSDSKYILSSGGRSHIAILFEVNSGNELMRFSLKKDKDSQFIKSAIFNKNNNYIMLHNDTYASLFETKTGKLIKTFENDNFPINLNFEFSPDGRYILFSSLHGKPYLYNLETLSEFKSIVSKDSADRAKFSPDGSLIICSNIRGNELKIYNLKENKLTEKITLDTTIKDLFIEEFEIDYNNKYLLFCSSFGNYHVIEINSGKEILINYLKDKEIECAKFTKQNELVISINHQGIKFIDLINSNESEITLEDVTGDFEFDKSFENLLINRFVKNDKEYCGIFNIKKNKFFQIFDSVYSIKLSPDAKSLAYIVNNDEDGKYFFKIINLENNDTTIFGGISQYHELIKTTDNSYLNILPEYVEEVNIDKGVGVTKYKLLPKSKYAGSSSDNNKHLYFLYNENNDSVTYQIINTNSGNVRNIKTKNKGIISWDISSDCKYFLTLNSKMIACLFDLNTCELIREYEVENIGTTIYGYGTIKFHYSPSDTIKSDKFIVGSVSGKCYLFETFSGDKIKSFYYQRGINDIINTENKKYTILTIDHGQFSVILDSKTFLPLDTLDGVVIPNLNNSYFHLRDYTKVFFLQEDSFYVKPIYQHTESEKSQSAGSRFGFNDFLKLFSFKNFNYLVATYGNGIFLIDINSGKVIKRLVGHSSTVNNVELFNNNYLVSVGDDHKTITWDLDSAKPLYTRITFSNNDYLVYDEHYRYDGTTNAINQLYFVCGLEVVELNQLKDSLYVPNLIQRIMSKENLDYLPKLENLNICGFTPVIESFKKDKKGSFYNIFPRKGGLGNVEIYINGILRLTVSENKLVKYKNKYELFIPNKFLEKYTTSNNKCEVKIIAKTKYSNFKSRALNDKINNLSNSENTAKPNLYAVIIGIDDYKGENIDLKYAAKDAKDFRTVFELASKKYFNYDDTNRVYIFSHIIESSGKITGSIPVKNNILKTLEKIKEISAPKDILVIYFAGHGELIQKNKLILLTSETSINDYPNYSGIAIHELLNMLSDIPATKRILILDACHSGAAINELGISSIAGVRDIEESEKYSQRIRELEKLSSKSGLALIAASKSNQKAIELPQYEHGLMTYALLSSMLFNEKVVNERGHLQLLDWFRETQKTASSLNENQNLECFLPINFTIGKIDDSVKKSISLKEIPYVSVSNVICTDFGIDILKIKEKIKNYLVKNREDIFSNKIIFSENQNSYDLNIVYTLNNGLLNCKVIISKSTNVLFIKEFINKNSDDGIKNTITDISNFIYNKLAN